MAEVRAVEATTRVQPAARALAAVGFIAGPQAAQHDSHLGGFAQGRRFVYLDASHFVWWTPLGDLPLEGYGAGAYGAGPYGSGGYSTGAYGAAGYGSSAYGKRSEE